MDRIEFQIGTRCGEVTEVMSAYVDGQLLPAPAEAVTAHLAHCRACALVFDRQLQTRRLLNLSEADGWTPPDLRLRIFHASAREPLRARRTLWPAGLLASAALVAMIAAFTLGAGPAGWTAAPAATPAPAATSPVGVAAPAPMSCPRLSGQALARCLGVSLHFLPTVLADARYDHPARAPEIHQVIFSPPSTERPSASLTTNHASLKGGANGRTSEQSRHGLVPE